MGQHFYQTSQFACKASVSIRTLRYYDKVGLLSPSGYTEAGYRLYTDTDLPRLQQILALKFLGFSLDEIKQFLQFGPTVLQETLAFQKTMLREKLQQLNTVIQAIEETEELLRANQQDWKSIVHVIQVIQMQQSNDWRKKYFTDEELKQMETHSKKYYTEEQRQQLAEWGKNFTEEDQLIATRQWDAAIAELKRLVSTNQDPTGPEAQALAGQWVALLSQFTHGDPGIQKSLNNMYKDGMKDTPFALPYNEQEAEYIQKAVTAYTKNQEP